MSPCKLQFPLSTGVSSTQTLSLWVFSDSAFRGPLLEESLLRGGNGGFFSLSWLWKHNAANIRQDRPGCVPFSLMALKTQQTLDWTDLCSLLSPGSENTSNIRLDRPVFPSVSWLWKHNTALDRTDLAVFLSLSWFWRDMLDTVIFWSNKVTGSWL